VSAHRDAQARREVLVDGRLIVLLLFVSIAIAVVAARVSVPLFLVTAAAALALVGLAAHRWPLAMLVVGALATLADPVIKPRLLPDGLHLGPIGLSEPVLVVVGAVVGIDAIRGGRLRPALRDPVTALVALFVALAAVSAFVNATPPLVALLGIVMTIDAIAIYLVVRTVRIGVRAAALAIGIVVAATLTVALFGIAQIVVHPELLGFTVFRGYFGEGSRITSFLGNPNPVAMILSIGLPFALFGSLSLPTGRWRWAARIALFVLVLGLLLTFSRSAWIAVGLGIALGALILDWRALPLFLLAVALAWGAVMVMPRGLALVPEGPDAVEPGETSPPDVIGSTAGRIGNLKERGDTRGKFTREGIPILLDHPLLGVGPGRYGGAAAAIIPSPIYEEYGTSLYGYRTVHNFWQHLLGESGALGTAVFLALLAGLLIRFVRAARAAQGLLRVVLAGSAAVVLVTGFHSFTEMIYEGNLPSLLIWLVFGIASLLAPVRPLRDRAPEPAG
jgi:O-antigen ligase